MESVDPTRIRYNILAKVIDLFQRDYQWFIHLNGSWESLGLGADKPDLKPGDLVHITIMKVEADG